MLSLLVYIFSFFYGLLVIAGFIFYNIQSRVIYRSSQAGARPEEVGLDHVEQLTLTAPDDTRIIAWHLQPAPGMPTLLYFHGNFCNLVNRKDRIKQFQRDGYGVFMIAFRGYSVTPGEASEVNHVQDAELAYDYLVNNGVKPSSIVIYGESLGAAVATQIAKDKEAAVLILESPFTSLLDLMKRLFPFLSLEHYLNDRYETEKHIAQVSTPVMIIHSLHDELIPFEFGQKVFAAAGRPKALQVMENVGHRGIFRAGAWKYVRNFIEEIIPSARQKQIRTSVPLDEDVYRVIDSNLPLSPFGEASSPSVH